MVIFFALPETHPFAILDLFSASRKVPVKYILLQCLSLLLNSHPLPQQGLFSRRRTLLLTTGPHLFYVDPASMILKGEIPFSPEMRVEPKNFKIFFVHTPNRTYYLEDPEGYSLEWCKAIEEMRIHTYGLVPSAEATNGRTSKAEDSS